MDISLRYVADLAATKLLEHNAQAVTPLAVNRKSYDTQVHSFNISTVSLITSVALAVIGLISMQAAFVLGALFYFIRGEVEKSLAVYQMPRDQAGQAVAFLRAMAGQVGNVGANVLANLGLGARDGWEPVEHKVFGHAVWMNTLPV